MQQVMSDVEAPVLPPMQKPPAAMLTSLSGPLPTHDEPRAIAQDGPSVPRRVAPPSIDEPTDLEECALHAAASATAELPPVRPPPPEMLEAASGTIRNTLAEGLIIPVSFEPDEYIEAALVEASNKLEIDLRPER